MWLTVYILGGFYLWIAILELVQPQECGIRTANHIIPERFQNRKEEALPNSWPWHVGVYSSALGPLPYCGGTLIASKWVLTAAHCITMALICKHAPYGRLFSYHGITGHHLAVTVGDHKHTLRQRPSYNVEVEGVIMHPSFTYDPSKSGYDVALLKLKRAVERTSVAEYACLPEPGFDLPAGYFCKFAGWGRIPNPPYVPHPDYSETLMEVAIQIAPKAWCKIEVPTVDDYDTICTNEAQGAPCKGDSGGGLHCLTQDGYKWVLYAVLSTTTPFCMGGADVFALTERKVTWIKAVMTKYT